MRPSRSRSWFTRFAKSAARTTGRPIAFIAAVSGVLLWAFLGPTFGYSNTWQLVINTATTVVTFLMVFIIQNTQNRDSEAIQIKLDELIRATPGANSTLLDLEELDEDELDKVRAEYEELAERARREQGRRSRQQPLQDVK